MPGMVLPYTKREPKPGSKREIPVISPEVPFDHSESLTRFLELDSRFESLRNWRQIDAEPSKETFVTNLTDAY